jgi:pimeloyl-ACP methyl ester carboxylesterase
MIRNMNIKFDKFYRKVSQDQVERSKRFRATHPYRQLIIDGITWQYTLGGGGEQAFLLLTGGMGIEESTGFAFEALENTYRIISPSYPLMVSIDQLVDGFVSILNHEEINRAHVLGQSLGGMLAQVLVRTYPERVETLILSHTFPTAPPGDRKLVQDRQAGETKLIKIMSWFPFWMIRYVTRKRLIRHLAVMKTPDKGFWEAYLYEATSKLTKEHILSNFNCGFDFYQNYVFSKDDLTGWPGKVLILESDDDVSHPSERKALKELYPQARIHTFHSSGHLTIVVEQEELLMAVQNFLGEMEK